MSHLQPQCDDERLQTLFAQFNAVGARVSSRTRLGFVKFPSRADQQRALAMNGRLVDGKEILVRVARSNDNDLDTVIGRRKVRKSDENDNDDGAFASARSGIAIFRPSACVDAPPLTLVDDEPSCRTACAALSRSRMIAVALTYSGETLCLVQASSLTAGGFLFDLLMCPSILDAGLRDLLESEHVVKAMHDCAVDCNHTWPRAC